MNRREFARTATIVSAGAAALPWVTPAAWAAAGDPVEGTNYVRLARPVPVSAPAGKVEVIEFFWYGCPHCFHFEPSLAAWQSKLPANVAFKRVPVAFRANPFAIHQRLYYALEGLGLVQALHGKVFHAMHVDKLKLDTVEAITDFVVKQGVDKAKFLSMFNSFAMQSKLQQARMLAEAYKIDGVPALGVAGRYFTSVSLNGTPEKTLATTNYLIELSRKA